MRVKETDKRRKLTDAQREELAYEYLHDETLTMSELAQRYGVDVGTISRTINNAKVLDKLETKATAAAKRALIRAQLASEEITALTVKDAKKERPDKFQYLSQNARRDVLDRAGVRAAKESEQDITIRFGESIDLGMPAREESETDGV